MDGYDCDFSKRIGRQSLKPLGVCNTTSTYDRKAGLFGNISKSPPAGVRKSLFEVRNKENEESMLCTNLSDLETPRVDTGKASIVVKTRTRSSISNEAEEKKIKPRRSMLGFRSKPTTTNSSKDDSTYSLVKPLHASSPLSYQSADSYSSCLPERRLHKAISTPTLTHPFDTGDADTSSFFTKGHSDSTWSVFKPTKNPDPPKNYPQEPVQRSTAVNGSSRFQYGDGNGVKNSTTNWRSRQSLTYTNDEKNSGSSMSVDQKLKLEWLSLKLQNISKEKMNVDKTEKADEERCFRGFDRLEAPSTLGARTRAQAKKEKEETMHKALSPIIQENEDNPFSRHSSKKSSISLSDSLSNSSTDSYIQNEATIVGRSSKKMIDIDEEIVHDLSISPKPRESNDKTDCSDEYLSTNEASPEPLNMRNFLVTVNNLKKENEELNCEFVQYQNKFTQYQNKYIQYHKKLDNFMSSLDVLVSEFQKSSKSKGKTPVRHTKKKVIAIKGRHSNAYSPASSSLTKPSKRVSKDVSEIKSKFNCFKTPTQISSKRISKLRKSTCYTPNSLSVRVGDQVKEIFGDM